MSKLKRVLQDSANIHQKHDKQKKTRHVFGFSGGSKMLMYKTVSNSSLNEKIQLGEIMAPLKLKGEMVLTEGRISKKDLNRLHKLINEKSKEKDEYIAFLYEEYNINKSTHRLSLRTGEIDRLSNG